MRDTIGRYAAEAVESDDEVAPGKRVTGEASPRYAVARRISTTRSPAASSR
jgi:hypothetical protein